MKKDTRFSIRKLSVGVASIAVASFLAGGSADAANLSPLYSKQVNPELPFEPFPSEIEYTQAETPWAPQESTEGETPVEESPVESPEFTEAEAPFANRDEEVSEPSEANYDDPEAPFAPVEEEVSEPSEANFVNPEDPFAEGVPANGENPAAPYGEGVPSNQVNPEAPFAPAQELGEEEPVEEEVSEPTEANFVNPEAPFAPGQKLGEEEAEEEPEATDLTELTPAEEEVVVGYEVPAPTAAASENVETTRKGIENELKNFSTIYAAALDTIINNPENSQRTKDFYAPVSAAAKSDQGQTILADYLDHYRKAKGDDSITLEQLVQDSADKKGGIYETLTVTAAKKLNFDGVEEGQDADYYQRQMTENIFLYKEIMKNGENGNFGAYAPRKEAQAAVDKVYEDMTNLLNAGTAAYRAISGNQEATPNDALAAGLDYYRKVAKKPEASLQDVVNELAKFEFSTNGALELAKQYVPGATKLSDITANYKEVMGTPKTKWVTPETLEVFDAETVEILNSIFAE